MNLKKKTKKPNNNSKPDPRSLLDKLTKEVESKGITFFEPNKNLAIDEEYLTLPSDLTECYSQDLGRYLNAFTQHRMYLRTAFGWQSVVVEEKRRDYIKHSSVHYAEMSKNKSLSETAKDKLINVMEDVLPYYESYTDEKEKLSLIEVALNSVDDGIFLISREISRRTQDWDKEVRNDNVQKFRRNK